MPQNQIRIQMAVVILKELEPLRVAEHIITGEMQISVEGFRRHVSEFKQAALSRAGRRVQLPNTICRILREGQMLPPNR